MPNFVDDLTSLPYPKSTLREVPGGKESKYLRATDWNTVCQSLVDARTAILDLRENSSSIETWTAGTYNAGAAVVRGPYMWRATSTTSTDPLVVEGNLGSGSDWSVQTTGGSGMSQSGTELRLINNITASATTAYRQSTNTDFLGKMLIVDIQMSGTADWLHFGLFDSAASQTATDINTASSTFYGLNINLFNARIENWIDGVSSGGTIAYSNANITNAAAAYSRWYLRIDQNSSNWDLSLFRNRFNVVAAQTGYSTNQIDDLALVAKFTNVARPSYSTWRFVVGARTGGSAGIFHCRGAWVRDLSAPWQALAVLPTGF